MSEALKLTFVRVMELTASEIFDYVKNAGLTALVEDAPEGFETKNLNDDWGVKRINGGVYFQFTPISSGARTVARSATISHFQEEGGLDYDTAAKVYHANVKGKFGAVRYLNFCLQDPGAVQAIRNFPAGDPTRTRYWRNEYAENIPDEVVNLKPQLLATLSHLVRAVTD